MDVDEEGYLRDGRGVIVREGELPEKFQTKYIGSSAKSGTKVKGSTDKTKVELAEKTILHLIGFDPDTSPASNIYEDSPDWVLTPQGVKLTDEQREILFQKIFAAGGRVPLIGKPELSIIIHKSPTNKVIHLCLELVEEGIYKARRFCTEPGCYTYDRTLASDIHPKCSIHKDRSFHAVFKVTDYTNRSTLVQLHTRIFISVNHNATELEKYQEAELVMCRRIIDNKLWMKYCNPDKLLTEDDEDDEDVEHEEKDDETTKYRHIPRSISRDYFENEEDALKKLALESTVGMFMKLAPGTQPFNNLDDIIPFVYGMEGELDERLKELGMELKIRRSLPPDEQKKVPYPFPGEYLFGSTVPQQAEKGKSFLYVIMSREMWYFGWSDTPGFEKRLKVGTKTDGANSNSWKEICAFVALFWGYEPMLAKYVTVE
ncbi:uncharacterized protein LOC118437544 isoform X2 [Folsomia candida]|uniref:uncharacterized protein LOC118437544 isoform X2 n=1 Tax=Folsomia candida TaxID=158441 RepID=UPI0016054BD5|nr:uncharacterized protein LOC118437544 isoform X2 [Folsomia candida]